MANTLNDLYLKYVNRVSSSLEKDKYFQYLFELVSSSKNTLSQSNQVLHKVVDEEWLTTIEDSLDALYRIIDNPRRFITTEEEVVPVSLAKKITSESVRHLSQNTQFITPGDEGSDIHPTKILNVTVKETYDLYENRFVFSLVRKLISFIDKRTNIIFWSTGDEKRDRFAMESHIKDGYEEIDYKVEMTVKKTQSFAENDSENMDVFMRIDRVRRLVLGLRATNFYQIMNGCTLVHSPIQKTNAITKNPDYRQCYTLWQFLERYDEIGYAIETIDEALAFDEEYVNQMYINLINNYTVFKTILDMDQRDLKELSKKKRKPLLPKFIKTVKEEIVDDYNIEDVEIRKVIIEEVTQAQLDAEAELAEKKELLEKAQAELEELRATTQKAVAQAERAKDLCKFAEERAFKAESQFNELSTKVDELAQAKDVAEARARQAKNAQTAAEAARDAAETKNKTDIAELRNQIKDMKQAQTERIEKERELRAQAEEKRDKAITRRKEDAEKAKALLESVRSEDHAAIMAERKSARDAILEANRAKRASLAEAEKAKKEAAAEAAKAKKAADLSAQQAKKEALAEAELLKKEALAEAERIKKEALSEAEQAKKAALAEANQIKNAALSEAEKTKKKAARDVERAQALQAKSDAAKAEAIAARKEAERQIKTSENARLAAEKEAERQIKAAEAEKLATEKEAERQIKAADSARLLAETQRDRAEAQIAVANKKAEAAEKAKAAAEAERDRAVEHDEANRVGKFIVSALRGKNKQEDK